MLKIQRTLPIRMLFAIVVIAGMSIGEKQGEAAECSPSDPAITIRCEFDKQREITKYSSQEIANKSLSLERGAARRRINLHRVHESVNGDGQDPVCADLTQATLTYLISTKSYIPNDLAPGSCKYEAALQHEAESAEAYKNGCESAISAIYPLFQNSVSNLPIVGPIPSAEAIRREKSKVDIRAVAKDVDAKMNKIVEQKAEASQRAYEKSHPYKNVLRKCK